MKKIKAFIRYTTLVVALIIGILTLSNQVKVWQQSNVLGTKDDFGFEQALVSKVIDGDTIELSDGRKVRYIGIDTPETKHPTKGVECFGQQAARKNEELVLGKLVQLEKDVSEVDRYGRLLRYVWLDGQMINKVLVSDGFAASTSYPPDIKHQDEFQITEQKARQDKLGLWGSCPIQDDGQLQQVVEQLDTKVLGMTDASEAAELLQDGCVIKGNISDAGKLYHLPKCSSYAVTKIDQTKGEQWFCSESEAQLAGWLKAAGCN